MSHLIKSGEHASGVDKTYFAHRFQVCKVLYPVKHSQLGLGSLYIQWPSNWNWNWKANFCQFLKRTCLNKLEKRVTRLLQKEKAECVVASGENSMKIWEQNESNKEEGINQGQPAEFPTMM